MEIDSVDSNGGLQLVFFVNSFIDFRSYWYDLKYRLTLAVASCQTWCRSSPFNLLCLTKNSFASSTSLVATPAIFPGCCNSDGFLKFEGGFNGLWGLYLWDIVLEATSTSSRALPASWRRGIPSGASFREKLPAPPYPPPTRNRRESWSVSLEGHLLQ